MHSSFSRRLGVGAVVLSLVMLVTSDLSAQATTQPSNAPPQVVTTGLGEVHITPDRAVISIGVQTRAATAAQAGADNAKRQRAILDTLRSLGASSDQLSTTNYSVFPEMASVSPQSAPKVTAYTVSNTVRVDVRRLEDISRFHRRRAGERRKHNVGAAVLFFGCRLGASGRAGNRGGERTR